MPKIITPQAKNANVAQKAPTGYITVRSGIVDLLNTAKQSATRNVNALMTASYWKIGRRTLEAEQKGAVTRPEDAANVRV